MDEDQWYALAKHEQSAAWKEGWDAAKAEYVPVLMEHLRILAELRTQVETLPIYHSGTRMQYVLRSSVLNLIDKAVE